MKNNVPKITALISITVILAVIIWFFAAQLIYRGENVESTYNEFKRVAQKLERVYLEEGSFKTEEFNLQIKKLIKSSPRLKAITLFSRDTNNKGILYIGSSEGDPNNLLTVNVDKNTHWTGGPEYKINDLFQEVQRMNFSIPWSKHISIDGIYAVLDHSDIFPGLLIIISVLGIFLILNSVILVLLPRLEEAVEYGEEEDYFDMDSHHEGLIVKTSQDYQNDQEFEIDSMETKEDNHFTYYEQPVSDQEDYEEEEEFNFEIPPEDDLSHIDIDDELPPLKLDDNNDAPIPTEDSAIEVSKEVSKNRSEDHTHRLFSEKSSLGYAEYLPTRLEGELERAASFDQDLILTILQFQGLEEQQEQYRAIADIILDSFPFKDLSFEYTENSYALILPNMDLDHGIRKMENFLIKMMHNEEIAFHLSIGLSSRNGRLISAKRLINEAKSALEKALTDGSNNIMGFRSDPDRFRKYLLEKKG